MIKVCKNCGKEFEGRKRRKFCGKSCSSSFKMKIYHQIHTQKGENNPNWRGGESKDAYNCYVKRYKKNNPEKIKVHRFIRYEKQIGRLIPQPCIICGKDKVDAHHEDYSKPLKIEWLCRKHHNEKHRLEKENIFL